MIQPQASEPLTRRLIVVQADGVLRVSSPKVSTCYYWLEYLGLKQDRTGWHKPGWRGAVKFFGEQWHAAAWPENPEHRK